MSTVLNDPVFVKNIWDILCRSCETYQFPILDTSRSSIDLYYVPVLREIAHSLTGIPNDKNNVLNGINLIKVSKTEYWIEFVGKINGQPGNVRFPMAIDPSKW